MFSGNSNYVERGSLNLPILAVCGSRSWIKSLTTILRTSRTVRVELVACISCSTIALFTLLSTSAFADSFSEAIPSEVVPVASELNEVDQDISTPDDQDAKESSIPEIGAKLGVTDEIGTTTSGTYTEIPGPPKPAPATANLVGPKLDQISGSAGDYSFSIPLRLPPGINGLTPNISLNYSSSGAKRSLIGPGFSLSSDNCIYRGSVPTVLPRTDPLALTEYRYVRGIPSFIDTDDVAQRTDIFWLNGERIAKCTGTQSCPAGTYRTYHDNFERIVQNQNTPSQFGAWVITASDGTIREYSDYRYRSDRTQTSFHDVTSWCLSRESKNGNVIDYRYSGDRDGLRLISEIRYGGQSDSNHVWNIVFEYENRSDSYHEEMGQGYESRWVNQRLKEIRSQRMPSAVYSKYKLTYETYPSLSGRNRLKSFQEFGTAARGQSPYTFNYASDVSGFSPGGVTSGLVADNQAVRTTTTSDVVSLNGQDTKLSSQHSVPSIIADINADGFPDIIRHDARAWNYGEFTAVWLGSAQGGWNHDPTWTARVASLPTFAQVFSGETVFDLGVRLVDLDGDGHLDVIQAGYFQALGEFSPSAHHYVALWNPTLNGGQGGFDSSLGAGFTNSIMPPVSGTYSSDDVIGFVTSYTGSGSGHSDSGLRLIDINGDGLPDIVGGRIDLQGISHKVVMLNTGKSFVPAPNGQFSNIEPLIALSINQQNPANLIDIYDISDLGVQFADINGDGLTDIIKSLKSGTPDIRTDITRSHSVLINTGRNFIPDTTLDNSLRALIESDPADLRVNNLRFWHFGRGFQPPAGGTGVGHGNLNLPTGTSWIDLNGDGRADFSQSLWRNFTFRETGTGWINNFFPTTDIGWAQSSPQFLMPEPEAYVLDVPEQQRCDLGLQHCSTAMGNPAYQVCTPLCLVVQGAARGSGLRFADVDSDGDLDIIGNGTAEYMGLSPLPRVYINNRRFDQDLVTRIKNPMGGSVSVTYSLKTSATNPEINSPRVVVSSITSDNGKSAGHSPSGADSINLNDPITGRWSATKNISYFGGRFDSKKGVFAGFRVITIEEPATEGGKIFNTTWYKNGPNDYCRFGVPEYSIVSEVNGCKLISNPFPTPYISLCLSQIADNSVTIPGITNLLTSGGVASLYKIHQASKTIYDGDCALNPSFPSVTRPLSQQTINFDLSSPPFVDNSKPNELRNIAKSQDTLTTFGYDSFGNRSLVTEHDNYHGIGSSNPSYLIPYRSYVTRFATPDLTRWRIGALCTSEIHAGVPSASSLQRQTNYYYDGQLDLCTLGANGWLTKKEDLGFARGAVDSSTSISLTYTPKGNLDTTTDSRGSVTQVKWTAPGLLEIVPSETINSLGHSDTFQYDTFGNLLFQIDPNGTKDKFEYDDFHRLTHKASLVDDSTPNAELLVSYESLGNPDAQRIVEAKKIDSTRFIENDTYIDGLGRSYLKVEKGGPIAYSTSISFNARGLESKRTLPYTGERYGSTQAGPATEYDALGRPSKITIPGGYITHVSHGLTDIFGRSMSWDFIRADNSKGPANSKFLVKDVFGRLRAVGECVNGNCSLPSTSDSNILWTTYNYDVTDNQTHICMSDGNGDCTNPTTSKVRSFYDGLGRLIGLKDPDLTNCVDSDIENISAGCPLRYSYDSESNLTRFTDANYAVDPSRGTYTSIIYDRLNRPVTKSVLSGMNVSPSGATTANHLSDYLYIYDDLVTECTPGNVNRFSKGRLVFSRYSGHGSPREDVSKCLIYDKFGRAVSETTTTTAFNRTRSATRSQTYNNDASVATTTIPLDTGTETIAIGYDDFGRQNHLSSSLSGTIVSNVIYDERGREKARTLVNGYSQTYTYRTGDPTTPLGDQRLAAISAFGSTGTLVMNLTYDYDSLGNILNIQNTKDGRIEVMTYDALMRLLTYGAISQSNPTKIAEQTFSYNTVGSRSRLIKSVATLSSGTTANPATRVVSEDLIIKHGAAYTGRAGTHAVRCRQAPTASDCTLASPTFVYDANGNITARTLTPGQTQTFGYNAANKLVRTMSPTGREIYYVYGPEDKKAAYADGTSTTFYFGPLELRGSSRFVNYTFGNTLVASREGNGEVQYHFQDQLGSTRYSEKRDSHIATTIDYDPFGNTTGQTGPEKLEYTYNGNEADSTGILDYNARSYDPKLGVFLQPDSIIPDQTNPQTLNRYAYVLNNPMGNVDPTGHFAQVVAYGIAVVSAPDFQGDMNAMQQSAMEGDVVGMAFTAVGLALPGVPAQVTSAAGKTFMHTIETFGGRLHGVFEVAGERMPRFVSNLVQGLGEKQTAYIVARAEKEGASRIVLGGSRVRGDSELISDIDVGYVGLSIGGATNVAGSNNKRVTNGLFGPDGLIMEKGLPIVPGFGGKTIPIIESPEEFFMRSGIRSATDGAKAGEPFFPSGFISIWRLATP